MNSFDIVIIGCGPAGLSALLWASELSLSAVALEAEDEPGGQLLRTYNRIRNHLGAETSDGREMRQVFLKQLEKHNPEIRTGTAIESIRPDMRQVFLQDGSTLSYKALIFATGVRRRTLGVPGENAFQGRGILRSGKDEAENAQGKNSVVIGGGDAAFENALILSDFAKRVTMIHRREEFSARSEFVKAVKTCSNIEILKNSIVKSIRGDSGVRSILVKDANNAHESEIDAEIVVVRIGVVPNSELLRGICETDKHGYIKIESDGLTTSNRIYAVGDVAFPNSPTISTAVGTAATAVKSIHQIIYAGRTKTIL